MTDTDISQAKEHAGGIFGMMREVTAKIQSKFLHTHVEVIQKYGRERGNQILRRFYELKKKRADADRNFYFEDEKLRSVGAPELAPRIARLNYDWQQLLNSPEPTIEDAIADLKL